VTTGKTVFEVAASFSAPAGATRPSTGTLEWTGLVFRLLAIAWMRKFLSAGFS